MRSPKLLMKMLAALTLGMVTFIAAFAIFFFSVPKFEFSDARLGQLAEFLMPGGLELVSRDLTITLLRPEGLPFSKTLRVRGQDVCVRYHERAVAVCIADLELALSAGWSGPRREDESRLRPRLLSIEPPRALGVRVAVDMEAMPAPRLQNRKGGVDLFGLLRTEILPKWRKDGSRIEAPDVSIIFKDRSRLSFKLDLVAGEKDLRAKIEELRFDRLGLRARIGVRARHHGPWKVDLDGRAKWRGKSAVLKSRLTIDDWRKAGIELRAAFRGVGPLNDLRFKGRLDEPVLDGALSVKLGASGARLSAVDFVDCRVRADLKAKTGGLHCGPETVRLALREKSFLRHPRLYQLAPQFELTVSRLAFGETRSAEFELDLSLDHIGIARGRARLKGDFSQAKNGPATYRVQGDLRLEVAKFARVTELLRSSRYAIPAPLNQLDGPVELKIGVAIDENGGEIGYVTRAKLDSTHQAVHVRLEGSTSLSRENGRLKPATNATLFFDRVHVVLPRFDFRVPPRFSPDRRFVSSAARTPGAKKRDDIAMDFRLRFESTTPGAIRIGTNLTKEDIPVDLHLTYEDSENRRRDPARLRPMVVGNVVFGQTPIDIFKRNALVDQFRIDFLPTGEARMNGTARVSYLDYNIFIVLIGTTREPKLRFASDPPLDDDQILAVLLFGRELGEIDDDQRTSVASLKAAFADAALGLSSLYLLANTPVESIGYDSERELVTAKVGIGGGASIEFGAGSDASAVGFRKRLSREFVFRSDVESLSTTGKKTVSALIEWVKRF